MSEHLYAGVDLGGTNLRAALADAHGETLFEASERTLAHQGPAAVIARIGDLVERLANQAGRRPTAVGIGVPGFVDAAAGVTRFLPNLPTQWRDVPLAAPLSERLMAPVRILNDCRVATLGELTFGHGRSVQSLAYISIGTGVGGGVVIDGKLRLGSLGAAGELGHQTVAPDGPLCGCGNRGCLEAVASGSAIVAEAIRLMLSGQSPGLHERCGGDVSHMTPAVIAAAVADRDAGALRLLDRLVEHLGIGAANVVTMFHPELIVIGGGLSILGESLLAPLRLKLLERVRMFPPHDVRIEISALGESAGLRGAVALAMRAPT